MRQVGGHRFRRQHPIREYVVDFVCMEKRLAVEIDGGQHAEHATYDTQRTKSLEAEGYRVLRFWNNDVLQNIEGVKAEIWRALSTPPPPCARGGRSRFRRLWPMDATPERDAAP